MTIDLTGEKFGSLTAVRPTEQRQCGHVIWECRCDCGNTRYAATNNLRSGRVKSCGCQKSFFVNIEGMRFGMLTAIKPTERRERGYVVWECKCDCGKTIFVSTKELQRPLKYPEFRSCGCGRNKRKWN